MADYKCWPLWWDRPDKEMGDVDPRTLPLSSELIERLYAWAAWYDSTLNEEYPPDSRFASEADEQSFLQEGRALTAEVRRELGPEFVVRYRGDW
jgi:hypothetical protein